MDTDYDALMQANLGEVFGERDPAVRHVAIRRLYAADAVLYEPDRPVQGHDAINDAVGALLATLPPDFSFTAVRPAIGHHGVGRLPWRAGPPDGPVAVTGLDVAHIENGLIQALYVFLDPPEA
ncbi:hypothetical protein ASE73_09350 [Sphingomonas sp. Leaf24]|uniref:nuclear transport factor 2 family protein n=1 Tax=unclassified Sphingomonas TaxID=196159 RepID=UPI0006F25E14|nr:MULTISPECIES: nuclear transport factor 2 family protein [unclassified Sphingomonas]KQM17179.1 hypothetical protein ASE50_07400 [Sphingomonas sp. Leaf5]KQM88072.1 hypothetical protein ASE73_09350 [Sphingomonas sp. Leaf24]